MLLTNSQLDDESQWLPLSQELQHVQPDTLQDQKPSLPKEPLSGCQTSSPGWSQTLSASSVTSLKIMSAEFVPQNSEQTSWDET